MGISERFLKFFAGTRISERFWTFYGDQNFFIPAWVFGGIRNNESYNKKAPKNFVGNLRCLTEYEKSHV